MNVSPLTSEQFQVIFPRVKQWISQVLQDHASEARPVSSAGFKRLPLYFSGELLESTKFVLVDKVPIPPLLSMGLTHPQFVDFEKGEFLGISYLDTFFLLRSEAENEGMYCHELIHALQWRLLGPEQFLRNFALGLSIFGYKNSPLEGMAFNAEAAFNNKAAVFSAEKYVKDNLKIIFS